jgi:hypothetical protein
MGKSNLPDGCDELHAIYFGSFIACTATQHKDGKSTPSGQRYRKWEWAPAHWREILPKPPAKKEVASRESSVNQELSHNPVVSRVA